MNRIVLRDQTSCTRDVILQNYHQGAIATTNGVMPVQRSSRNVHLQRRKCKRKTVRRKRSTAVFKWLRRYNAVAHVRVDNDRR